VRIKVAVESRSCKALLHSGWCQSLTFVRPRQVSASLRPADGGGTFGGDPRDRRGGCISRSQGGGLSPRLCHRERPQGAGGGGSRLACSRQLRGLLWSPLLEWSEQITALGPRLA
jgi:hypothetical protein